LNGTTSNVDKLNCSFLFTTIFWSNFIVFSVALLFLQRIIYVTAATMTLPVFLWEFVKFWNLNQTRTSSPSNPKLFKEISFNPKFLMGRCPSRLDFSIIF
jgi:hypothetical protein